MGIYLELEQLLDIEIQTFDEIEKTLAEKKSILVKGEPNKLKPIDEQLIEYNKKLETILIKKTSINKELGDEKQTLSALINNIQDTSTANRLTEKKLTINSKTKKIEMLNSTITELIKHALNLIENSVLSIAEALNPKSNIQNVYNQQGKRNNENRSITFSSIVEDA